MRPSESNSLLRALAAQDTAGEHPDTGLLTAFAEGSLLERERETLMAHLATCSECREVLRLCAVEEQRPAKGQELTDAPGPKLASVTRLSSRPRLRVWIPWGAVAAGIAIASVVALRYAERQTQIPHPHETQMAEVKTSPPVSIPATPSPLPQKQLANKKKAAPAAGQPAPIVLDNGLNNNLDSLQANERARNSPANAQNNVTRQPYQPPPTQTLQQFGLSQAKSEAQVQREARSLRQLPPEETRDAKSAPASEKPVGGPQAVALANSLTAGALSAPAIARPHWRINEQGHPERSFADGVWQPVLINEPAKMHVVSVVKDEVWVGGEDDRIYRSKDDGVTWLPVILPQKNGVGHVIAHIRFESGQTGTIEAADGTAWATHDGGTTWN